MSSIPCHSTLVLGIKADSKSHDFVDRVLSFCGSKNVNLHLVHAMEETAPIPSLYTEILGSFDLSDIDKHPSARQMASQCLETLKSSLKGCNSVSVEIADSKDPTAVLISAARRAHASL